MARRPRPWFRVYVEVVRDPKIRRRTPTQRWLWVAILAAARQSPIPGFLAVSEREPMTNSDIADFAGVTIREVRTALPLFEKSGMLDWDDNLGCWEVTNFTSRQYESDDVTARTRKHRAKERDGNVPTPPDGTTWERSGNGDERALGTHQSRAEQSRAERDTSSSTTSDVVGGHGCDKPDLSHLAEVLSLEDHAALYGERLKKEIGWS
jgi:hypothetical protein